MPTFGDRMRQALDLGEHGPAPWFCPACGDYALYRSRSVSWIERAVWMRIYRCHTCQDRRRHLRVVSASELPKRGDVRVRTRHSRRIPVRGLVAAVVLAAALAVVAWAFAWHRNAIREKGEQVLSLGHAWWLGAHSRLLLMESDLKVRLSPPQPSEAAASAPSAGPPRPQPSRTQRRSAAAASRTAAATVLAENAGGLAWRSARWGMPVDQVLAAFPTEAVRVQANAPDPSTRLSARVAIEHAAIGTRTYDVSFFFRGNGRLAAIKIAPDSGVQSATDVYRELADLLSREHGQPASHDTRSPQPGALGEVTTWKTPESSITLSVDEPPPQGGRILAIDIGTGEIREAPQGVVLWYQPVSHPPVAPRRADVSVARSAR